MKLVEIRREGSKLICEECGEIADTGSGLETITENQSVMIAKSHHRLEHIVEEMTELEETVAELQAYKDDTEARRLAAVAKLDELDREHKQAAKSVDQQIKDELKKAMKGAVVISEDNAWEDDKFFDDYFDDFDDHYDDW